MMSRVLYVISDRRITCGNCLLVLAPPSWDTGTKASRRAADTTTYLSLDKNNSLLTIDVR